MMQDDIRISALGRYAQIGDLYNFSANAILPGSFNVPNERKRILETLAKPTLSCRYQKPQLLTDYLTTNKMDGDKGYAQVTLLFRIVRQIEILDLDFLRSKIVDYHKCNGRATHVIEEILYGTEIIFSMCKALDIPRETKESAEFNMYLAAKMYLEETVTKSPEAELPVELANVFCLVLSNVEPDKMHEQSFHSFNNYLQDILSTEMGMNQSTWTPVEFLLRKLPYAQMESKLWKDEIALQKEQYQITKDWVANEFHDISNDQSFKRFPPLEKLVCHFQDLLPHLWKKIEENYNIIMETLSTEEALEEMQSISNCLNQIYSWFICRKKEIQDVTGFLEGNDFVLLDLADAGAGMTRKDCKIAKLFVLEIEYQQDQLINAMQTLIGQPSAAAMLPVLPIFSNEKDCLESVRKAFSIFASEARLSPLNGTSYGIGLADTIWRDGAILTVDCSGKSPVVVQTDNLLGKNRRIAEIYADESKFYSKLKKEGSPNIYYLNTTEKSKSDNIKWFDICKPDGSSRPHDRKKHKTIILMGAVGSGKSTLIDGMVNYILGVQWNDPFRFKCVREDENVKNQAHSQTSSVTAYTLHHQDGMTIPYSITIIDTPGYGDTRGMKRDKEITANIHRFLIQQETRIDELHAVCFVVASGDSRLTVTQRYIIDSVPAIFGKDMKENLRLLVTFADNAVPPVIGACRDSNFPVTSSSDGISCSKFNSSVLYYSNAQQEEDEFNFDELFWDMGQENFQKFFVMLEGMKGKDLKSTREVIHSRCQMKQSLTDIEQEMEVCLTNIENIEILQREMKICRSMFTCPNGLFAYNCQRCHDTCERQIPSYLCKGKITCKRQQCKCPASEHRVEQWEWRMDPKKMSVRCLDLKAKYEKSSKHKMTIEELLDTCSENLQLSKGKALSLLDQVAKNVQLLESKALRSNVVSPSDYLSLMKCRVLEENAPGYLARIETLDELQRMLASDTSQQRLNTAARESRKSTLTLHYSDGAPGISAPRLIYNQPISRNQTTLTTPPSDDQQTQTKTGSLKYMS